MENIEIHYEGDNLHIKIPVGMTDEHGKLLVENIEEKLQSWGINEMNEVNPDYDKYGGLWLDSGNKNIYFWDDAFTNQLKDNQEAVLEPKGKLSEYVDVDSPEGKEFLVWYYGEPLDEAIKQMYLDCEEI